MIQIESARIGLSSAFLYGCDNEGSDAYVDS